VSALSVQGASSWAGKSLVATALCRWFARRGVRVAPFKAQNMSNNARVASGGEIGAAQWLQALAAGVQPDVRMNPVLVKPEGDTDSQVVVLGRPDAALSARPWRDRSAVLWPAVESSLRSLQVEFDLVVLEGAGSPAEINLLSTDLANMRSARLADAAVLLLADIDRGGAFAHLYGTWRLLERPDRGRVRGFLLNKFRGDPDLLHPAPELLRRRTGVRTLGVLPWLEHGLPDEDGAADPTLSGGRPRVAVVRYPTASNLDEYRRLEQVADVVWARKPADLAGADLVVLPGSKNVEGDGAWLLERGFAPGLRGRRLLAVCGGLQLLGEEWLGLLPLRTTFAPDKAVRPAESRFGELPPPWDGLSGLAVAGYEIRHGSSHPTAPLSEALPGGLGWVSGDVLAVYVHGLLEQPEIVQALLGAAPARSLEETFDLLAGALDAHVEMDAVAALAGV
jgi:adenosylcobyric acid synthase